MEDTDVWDHAHEEGMDNGEFKNDAPAALTWKYSHINDRVAKKGWDEKIKLTMLAQIGLGVYYAYGYVQVLEDMNRYYIWPEMTVDDLKFWESEEDLNMTSNFRETEETFVCDGFNYYLVGHGPKYPNGLGDSEIQGLVAEGTWVGSLIVWSMLIFFFSLFCFHLLYRGQYNKLLGFVTFATGPDGRTRPVKFAIAFTLVCNFAKGAGGLFISEKCDRMVFLDLMNIDIVQLLVLFCVLISFVALFFWVMIWGCCFVCRHESRFFTGICFFWVIRAILLLLVFSAYINRAINFFPFSVNFDLNYTSWFVLSIVSSVDLILSTAFDVYISKPWRICVGAKIDSC